MASTRYRRFVLVGLVVLFTVLTTVILFDVLATVFFAITLAYVLLPVRHRLVARQLSAWSASALASILAFVVVLLLVLPVGVVLYLRLNELFTVVQELPSVVTIQLLGFEYAVEADTIIAYVFDMIRSIAPSIGRAAPIIALKSIVLVLVLFALLLRPDTIRAALLGPIPPAYCDIPIALHERVRTTLAAIYILQAATAVGTFAVAWIVFGLLGYESAFSLAVIAGIFQFIPIIGPSVLVIGLALYELFLGTATAAVLVGLLGIVMIGFLPDAVIRPRLTMWTTDLPTSLYFVGFVGGLITIGAVGVIAGPLVVALLVEVVELLVAETDTH